MMNKEGLTLTELLVSSILIGIVMIGVASFSASIGQIQSSTDRSTILAIRTRSVMDLISRDAYLAIGDDADRGAYSYSNGVDRNSLCLRHDTADTPEDYDDDTWVCYYHGNSFDLHRCVDPGTDPTPPNGCTSSAECCTGASEKIDMLTLADDASDYAAVVNDTDGRFDHIELNLTIRYFWNEPMHPIKNPEYTLTTQVVPPGHSK